MHVLAVTKNVTKYSLSSTPEQWADKALEILKGKRGGNYNIVKIDPDNNLIAVKGAVPGAKGGIVYLRNTVK